MRLCAAFLFAATLVACSGGEETDTGKTRPPKEETPSEPFPLTDEASIEEGYGLVQMPVSIYLYSVFTAAFGDGVCPEVLAATETEVDIRGGCTASDGTVYTGSMHAELDASMNGTVTYEDWGSTLDGEGLVANGTHALSSTSYSATGAQSLTVEITEKDETGAMITHAGTWTEFDVALGGAAGTFPIEAVVDITEGERTGLLVATGSLTFDDRCDSPVGGEVVLSGTQDVTLTPDGCSRGGCVPWTAEDGTTGEICP